MAKPKKQDLEYQKRAEKMGWKELKKLWGAIQSGNTPGWDAGKALEHLIIRAFRLSGLEAEYPYDVPPGGKPLEQIDGFVYMDGFAFLIECKDKDSVDIEAIAKLRNQLLRRPDTTLGCVFTAGDFTEPALTLADFAVPHRILLWPGDGIEECLKAQDFKTTLEKKYRHLCKFGLTDLSPYYRDFTT
jgi:Restriction endonuclease